jgi:predicted Zn-ribbon and HTH transcriptional regulator
MAQRTTYTSTISVPIYTGWKCEQCQETNFSAGVIVCKREETTSALRSSKHEEAKTKAANLAKSEWADNALKIIEDPNHNASIVRSDLFVQNTKCTRCGAKPSWDKDMKYLTWFGLLLVPTIISAIVAFATLTSVVAWLVFAVLGAIMTTCIISEKKFKKTMETLPKRYNPIIGSLNAELIEHARKQGKIILTPDEVIEVVNGVNKPANKNDVLMGQDNVAIVGERVDAKGEEEYIYCRKCGEKLMSDSSFCHKCGTQIVKQ